MDPTNKVQDCYTQQVYECTGSEPHQPVVLKSGRSLVSLNGFEHIQDPKITTGRRYTPLEVAHGMVGAKTDVLKCILGPFTAMGNTYDKLTQEEAEELYWRLRIQEKYFEDIRRERYETKKR